MTLEQQGTQGNSGAALDGLWRSCVGLGKEDQKTHKALTDA